MSNDLQLHEQQSVLLADGTVVADSYTWLIENMSEDDANEVSVSKENASAASSASENSLKNTLRNTIVSVANLALLAQVTGKKGVLITVDDDLETLLAENALPLASLDIIAIYFANFNDGRGYSYAALLRRAGYTGELRAVGDVFKDTLFYMKRCGFGSFVLKPEKQTDEAKDGIHTFSQSYQACQLSGSQYQTGQVG